MTLKELQERLENAEEPSRRLDIELHNIRSLSGHQDTCDDFEVYRVPGDGGADSYWSLLPPYTGSQDAAVALVEKMLPGWQWSISQIDGCCAVDISDPHEGIICGHDRSMKAPPALVLCTALVEAMRESE